MSYTRQLLQEDCWNGLTSDQQKFFIHAEQELTPALTNLANVINKHSMEGNNQLLIEAGILTTEDNRLLEEGMMDSLKGLARAGAEKFRRPPSGGHIPEASVKKLITNIVAQHNGTDVVGIKKELGSAWKDLKDTDKSEILSAAGWVNNKLNELGQEAQKMGVIQDIDNAVDNWLPKLKQKFPKQAETAEKIGNWAKENKGKSAIAIAVLAAAVNFSAGLVPAIAVGMLLRAALGQMQNPHEKLSSSLGQAAKITAGGLAAAGAIGAVMDIGQIAADKVAAMVHGTGEEAAGQIISATPGDLVAAGLREKAAMMRDFAERMGIEDVSQISGQMQGGVPVEINGMPVPEELYSPEQLQNLQAAQQVSAAMSGDAGGADAGGADTGGGRFGLTTDAEFDTITNTPVDSTQSLIDRLEYFADNRFAGKPGLKWDLTGGSVTIEAGDASKLSQDLTIKFSDMSMDEMQGLEDALKKIGIDEVRIWDSMGRHARQ